MVTITNMFCRTIMNRVLFVDTRTREENLRGFPALWRADPRPQRSVPPQPPAPSTPPTSTARPTRTLRPRPPPPAPSQPLADKEWQNVKQQARRDLGHPDPVSCSMGSRCKTHVVSHPFVPKVIKLITGSFWRWLMVNTSTGSGRRWCPNMSDKTKQTLLANVRSARRKWRVAGGWWKRQLSSTTCLISVKIILGQRHTLSLELKRQRFVLSKNKIFYVRVRFRKTLPHMIRQLRKLNFNLQNTWKWYKAVLSSPIWRIKYLRSSKYDLFKH